MARDGGHEQLISNGESFKPTFAERDQKLTMIDLRAISKNWFKNQLFASIRLSRLRTLVLGIGSGIQIKPFRVNKTVLLITYLLLCEDVSEPGKFSSPLKESQLMAFLYSFVKKGFFIK